MRSKFRWNDPMHYMGENALFWQRSDRHLRFLEALTQANLMKRLSSENGQGWISGNELVRLPGLKNDKYERAIQLNALEDYGFIKTPHGPTAHGFWSNTDVMIDDYGLQVVNMLGPKVLGLILLPASRRCIEATATMDVWR